MVKAPGKAPPRVILRRGCQFYWPVISMRRESLSNGRARCKCAGADEKLFEEATSSSRTTTTFIVAIPRFRTHSALTLTWT
ncbi:hypothetical protein KQX54_004214 [Cotesia glomerata]|uniref:Uncharacterized protein n=1 Tax=Cotesia glomerata TaxID=32391 RepID=A0AAV7HY55_COTGL|nr:hypothetical protein KQX54_004214 [Cotesia glomerata]